MKIFCLGLGGRGEMELMLSISIGLKERGHEVSIGANPNFESFIEKYNMKFFPFEGSLNMKMSPEAGKIIASSLTICCFTKNKRNVFFF